MLYRAISIIFFKLVIWRQEAEVFTYQFWGDNICLLKRYYEIDLY